MEREILIPLNPKTEFEKLLFAQSEIKRLNKIIEKLNFKIGILKSDKSELEYELIKSNKEEKLTKSERKNIKKENYVASIIERNKILSKKNKQLNETNGELVSQILQLKKKLL